MNLYFDKDLAEFSQRKRGRPSGRRRQSYSVDLAPMDWFVDLTLFDTLRLFDKSRPPVLKHQISFGSSLMYEQLSGHEESSSIKLWKGKMIVSKVLNSTYKFQSGFLRNQR